MMKEALLYEKLPEQQVRCRLCAHGCRIAPGRRGLCGVRENRDGVLVTLVYGRPIAQHVDPIEKKPLFHFHPGSAAYSIATVGCNFRCAWCQNAEISQLPPGQSILGGQARPEDVVAAARQAHCQSIAYTYTEPTVFFEYAVDIARLAQTAGIANVIVTNGFMTSEMLDLFAPCLDAANVDLKAFRDDTYREYAGASLQPVLDTLVRLRQTKVWVEVTTLVIPEINDDPGELRALAEFISTELGPETPWHISRFFPHHRMSAVPPTPVPTLERARDTGREAGLHYVYFGNLRTRGSEDTLCPGCGCTLVERHGYGVLVSRLAAGQCTRCGTRIAGVGMDGPEVTRA